VLERRWQRSLRKNRGGSIPGRDRRLPAFLDVPFPSDAYMQDGRFASTLPGLERTFKNNADVLAALTSGWSAPRST
jgi:hypothetical protein